MTDKERYEALVQGKMYGEMSEEELDICDEYECDLLINGITKLREQGVEDYKISAYLHDLYNDYLVNNDIYIADQAGISDEDYCKGLCYWRFEMEEDNPLSEYTYQNDGLV